MKLVNKISLWFITILFMITPISMYIAYSGIKKEIDNSEIERMQNVNLRVANQLTQGEKPDPYTQGRPIQISEINTPLPLKKTAVVNSSYYDPNLKRKECKLTVTSYYHIGDKNYRIASYNYVTKSNQILNGIVKAIIWKMILVIVSMAVTARILSQLIFDPFRQTMKVIHGFNLRQKESIKLSKTSTTEFKELNSFLQKMTDKAIEDYAAVKEFSENASHELQTPLAVIRSKLELLSETNINETQAGLIVDMQNAIDKLSRINRSLTLLTKLENKEFETTEQVKFCRITEDALAAYEDWIVMKEIAVNTRIDKSVSLKIHHTLAEMLVTNLLSNAIRHNTEGGSMTVELTSRKLRITNTGAAPEIPIDELFNRFKKSNQCADSIGLGLAIVKQICEVNHFAVDYRYQDGWHTLSVYFDARDKEAYTPVAASMAAPVAV
jgi:two-component system sensor histidine kinase QseC